MLQATPSQPQPSNCARPTSACCFFVQLSLDLKELESPEELHPLKDALERAKQRVDQSTGIREALEAEVCLSKQGLLQQQG